MTSPDPRLAALGWRPFFADQLTPGEAAAAQPVRVMAIHRGRIAVAGIDGDAMIAPDLPRSDDAEDQPAAGDWLLLDRATRKPLRLLRRASLFKRRAAGHGRKLQLIAANVDTLFIVAACHQDFNLARIERYLVLAREVGVHPVVVLTKADLVAAPQRLADAARGLQPALELVVVDARDPAGVATLAARCGPGQTVALLGSSGVGKSTLINSLRGSDHLATQPVRGGDGKGRHTTTAREMHRLAGGGWLLDTPGMRELQLSDAAAGLDEVFDDVVALALACKFTNCGHASEPDCAVQAALRAGTLDAARLDRWRKLGAEDALNSRSLAARRRR